MTTLIISGKSGHGKDKTAAFMKQRLEEEGKRVIICHYGDAVKWVIKDFFDWNGEKDEHGRHLLQWIGTDVVRTKYPNFWVGIVSGLLSSFEEANLFDVAIIPDARFENEVEVTMDTLPDSFCIRVERKDAEGNDWVNPALTEEQRQHPSETSLDDYGFDYVIHNDEGLDTLHESALAVLRDLGLIEGEQYAIKRT